MNIIEIPCLWDKLKDAHLPILLYGMGDGADKIINALEQYGVSISGVFCSDALYREKTFHGYKVMKYSTAKEIFGKMIVLMAFGSDRDDVLELVKTIAQEQELYVPDVPVFGEGLFNTEFFLAHKAELEQVYDLLADNHSKIAFENIINFKLSGKADYLYPVQTDSAEAFRNILKLNDSEHYLDLGAYDGDTAIELVDKTGGYSSITCLEPSRRNFKKLERNLDGWDNVTLINCAAGEKAGEASFDSKAGRSAHLHSGGGDTVPITAIDDLGGKYTYIKFDVEGNELAAIAGGKNTIANQKPKLLISAYHKNEDLFSIPQAVLDCNPDYKVYLRHYKYLPAWDTNFYFV